MTPKIRAEYIAKLVLYVNASIEVCCWGSLPTGIDYYDTYTSLDLIDAFGKEMVDIILEAQYGWIREDHLGQTHEEYLQSQEWEKDKTMSEITLRDKIAIATLQGLIQYMGCDPEAQFHGKEEKNKDVLSKSAYAYADAMLMERSKK